MFNCTVVLIVKQSCCYSETLPGLTHSHSRPIALERSCFRHKNVFKDLHGSNLRFVFLGTFQNISVSEELLTAA